MGNRKIRVLFNVCADAENDNAQSLNAREIALRLDPERFHSTLFFERTLDPRLARTGIRLVKLPERRRTLRLLREMLGDYDAILYMDLSPASYASLHVPRLGRRSRPGSNPYTRSRHSLPASRAEGVTSGASPAASPSECPSAPASDRELGRS